MNQRVQDDGDEKRATSRRAGGRPARTSVWLAAAAGLLVLALAVVLPGVAGTRPILKIGLSAPFTGWDEPLGYEVIHSVRLALRERNQRGGAGGYNIELAALDDRNEPAEAAQQVRELAVDPDILGALGGLDNQAMLAAMAEVHKAGLGYIIVGGTAAGLTDRGYGEVFRLAPRDEAVAAAAVDYAARTLQARRIAVVQDPAEAGLAVAFAAAVGKAGMPVIYSGEVRRWQLDFGPLVSELRANQADAVLFAGRVAEAGPLLEQARAAGLRFALVGGPALDDSRLSLLAGAAMEPSYCVGLGSLDPNSPFAAGYSLLAGKPPNVRAALAYDGAGILLDAIARAASGGRPTRARVIVELARTESYPGVTGRISFDKKGDSTQARPAVYQLVPKVYPGAIVR